MILLLFLVFTVAQLLLYSPEVENIDDKNIYCLDMENNLNSVRVLRSMLESCGIDRSIIRIANRKGLFTFDRLGNVERIRSRSEMAKFYRLVSGEPIGNIMQINRNLETNLNSNYNLNNNLNCSDKIECNNNNKLESNNNKIDNNKLESNKEECCNAIPPLILLIICILKKQGPIPVQNFIVEMLKRILYKLCDACNIQGMICNQVIDNGRGDMKICVSKRNCD